MGGGICGREMLCDKEHGEAEGSVLDAFTCRTHRDINCEEKDCKEISALRWMLARISAAASESINTKATLKYCHEMAQEALGRRF